jgi:glycosyltransferase involved in cell wall biosynthesis
VGQLAPHKGVHTLLEAFARLACEPRWSGLSLTLVGGSFHAGYVARLREIVSAHALSDRVRFLDQAPRQELPPVYHAHDVLVFPSVWEEPFGLTQIEAMACGLPVIGTGTGGSAEILTGETALRFPPGDVDALAGCIARLAADPELRRRLGAGGARRVAERFDLEQTARQTREYLEHVASLPRTPDLRARWKMPLSVSECDTKKD